MQTNGTNIFCPFFANLKVNNPGKLMGTVIIYFVHESFINIASDSSPGSNDALRAQMRRGCVLLQPLRLRCSMAAAWPVSLLAPLGQGQLFVLQPDSTF